MFCPASGDNWASTEPNTALVRFQHFTCEERGIVVLKCGEKAPYRHPILETGSSILWKVLCPWRACRETLRKHFSPGTIRDWASKSNHAESIVIIGGGCLELGKLFIIILKSLSLTQHVPLTTLELSGELQDAFPMSFLILPTPILHLPDARFIGD